MCVLHVAATVRLARCTRSYRVLQLSAEDVLAAIPLESCTALRLGVTLVSHLCHTCVTLVSHLCAFAFVTSLLLLHLSLLSNDAAACIAVVLLLPV